MWHVNTELNTPCPRIDDENGRGVAHVIQRDPHPAHGQGVTNEEAMRRARLIAAAPDLLEALQRIADGQEMSGTYTFGDVVLRYQEIARAAIARATGEPQ